MDPESKLLLVIDVGTRTLAMAQRVVHQVVQVLGAGLCPAVFDRWPQGVRHGIPDPFWPLDATGAAPRQRPAAQTALDAPARAALCAGGEVVPAPAHRRRQVPGGVRHDGAGAAGAVGVRLARSIRPLWSGSTWTSASAWRRWAVGSTRCARARTACASSWRCSTRYTISVCPMPACASPCWFLSRPTARGSAKVWRPCTPAMAAGLTDHVWTLQEVLLYRVPPWPQPQAV